jgi:cell division protein ZapE
MTPSERYQAEIAAHGLQSDPAQALAAERLTRIHQDLLGHPRGGGVGLFGRRKDAGVRGLYLWGGVGRGKTFLVDLFFAGLPLADKRRLHFHRFMREIHTHLKALGHQRAPLEQVAEQMAAEWRLLCLDEFHVGDITDAMLLGPLLRALIERGVTLVATSNEAPERLYAHGLQRERFLPAIALLRERLECHAIAAGPDYRLRILKRAEIYHRTQDGQGHTAQALAASFAQLAPEPGEEAAPLAVDGREIRTRRLADGVVWFDFAEICAGPRAASDYLEIARCFQAVLVEGIPVFTEANEDPARRFIALVDTLYDHGVKLVCSAAAEPEDLYRGARLREAFARTASRLREMRTTHYLARPHNPG